LSGPIRITAALDRATAELLENEAEESSVSQSEIIRRALRFYHAHKNMTDASLQKKLRAYMDMLLSGEHVILDVNHLLLFLNLIDNSPTKENFWIECREVAKSHAEQFKSKILTPKEFLERLEVCNFFRINKESENEFTLILFSEVSKEFIKILLEEVFKAMGSQAEIKLDLTKIRVTLNEPAVSKQLRHTPSVSRFFTDKPRLE
jgi:uncharacterized protein (DUF1778 family)